MDVRAFKNCMSVDAQLFTQQCSIFVLNERKS